MEKFIFHGKLNTGEPASVIVTDFNEFVQAPGDVEIFCERMFDSEGHAFRCRKSDIEFITVDVIHD